MADASEADAYLLDEIARGNTDAWSHLVERYQGRLHAFARSRLAQDADAADLVQETFLLFLQSWRKFRRDASLETYLFMILRRRMIDQFRGARLATCAIGDSGAGPIAASADPSPSWYVRRDEEAEKLEQAIAAGLDGMIRRLRDDRRFIDLRAAELLFYAQLRNKEAAKLCGIDEKQISVFKFRALEQIRAHLTGATEFNWADTDAADSLLTRVWEQQRPTCPKRSTLGRLLLGTLDPDWRDYVDFHLHQLGCRPCLANFQDLQRDQSTTDATHLRERVFQSTVGFLAPR